jgi:hypothetical protein
VPTPSASRLADARHVPGRHLAMPPQTGQMPNGLPEAHLIARVDAVPAGIDSRAA